MAAILFCDGQPSVVNLDNTDFIRIVNSGGRFNIEFYKSERTSKTEKPIFICAWTFIDVKERDETMSKLIDAHGSKLEFDK